MQYWEDNYKHSSFEDFKGQVFTKITNEDDRELSFETRDGREFVMTHFQDCCENVYLAEIHGELDDLLNSPIVEAEVSSNHSNDNYESCTWTFYKLGTVNGSVTLRWCGSSNGYYSESVDVIERKHGDLA